MISEVELHVAKPLDVVPGNLEFTMTLSMEVGSSDQPVLDSCVDLQTRLSGLENKIRGHI